MTRRSTWLLVALVVLGGNRVAAQGMIDRFGPDGLPFTQDDPLHVGGHSSPVRFGALGADACSEEPGAWGDARSAHAHPSSHPSETATEGLETHTSHPTPGDYASTSAFVTAAPFDTTIWVAGVNLDNGQVGRYRAFPEDDWINEIDKQDLDRGWVTGWGPEDKDMDQVSSGTVRNLHLATLGLSYRDVKARLGLSVAIKWPTLDQFPEFREKMAGQVERIDLFAQEAYVEAWINELQNLDNLEAGISGRFVLDLAGLQINAHMAKFEKSQGPCTAVLDPYYVQLGGPVNTINTAYPTVVDYFINTKWDAIWDMVRLEGLLGLCSAFKGIAKGIATEEVKKKLEPMDDVATFVDLSEYQVIGLYSGLAGRDEKNPFDRVALGTLKQFGQFRAAEWQRWGHIDEGQALIGFEDISGADMVTGEEAFQAQNGWRYNNGSSYIDKSMMMFGNSGGTDRDGDGPRLDASPSAHDAALFATADVLRTYAMQWLYVRLDIVDPYALPEAFGAAAWIDTDLLFPKEVNPPGILDWPPPNYGFGRAQVVSFRGASGGEPVPKADPGAEGGQTMSVDPATALIWKGLVSVDPVTRTYAVAGMLYRQDDPSTIWFFGDGAGGPTGTGSTFGWSEPRELGSSFPAYLQNSSGRRWLTAAANHWGEGQTELRWGWDFDTADGSGALDSPHAQHMSDIGNAAWGGVFAYQTKAEGGDKGRTGFALVDQQAPLP